MQLTAKSSNVYLGEVSHLDCIVKGAENLNDEIVFLRSESDYEFASFSQKGNICTSSKKPRGRNTFLRCGFGTNKTESKFKKYRLVFIVAAADLTTWKCHLRKAKQTSNTLTLIYKNICMYCL